MRIRRRWSSYNALQFFMVGVVGVLVGIVMANDEGWLAVIVGLAGAALVVLSVIALIRNHREAKRS